MKPTSNPTSRKTCPSRTARTRVAGKSEKSDSILVQGIRQQRGRGLEFSQVGILPGAFSIINLTLDQSLCVRIIVVNSEHIDQEISVCGWVNRRRDHGGVIFVDLRDNKGILQVVFDPDDAAMFADAETLRNEFVLQVEGKLRQRPEGTDNPEMATGEVELLAHKLEILNASETPPFQLDDDDVHDDNRLRYRYIDLRKPGNAVPHAAARADTIFLRAGSNATSFSTSKPRC